MDNIQPLARWKTVSLHQFGLVPSPSFLFSQPTHLEVLLPKCWSDWHKSWSQTTSSVPKPKEKEWTAVNEMCKSVQILSGSKWQVLKLCLTILGWNGHSLRRFVSLISCYHYIPAASQLALSAVQNIQANNWFHAMTVNTRKELETCTIDRRPNFTHKDWSIGLARQIQNHRRKSLWTECTGALRVNRAALSITNVCLDACSYTPVWSTEDKQVAPSLECWTDFSQIGHNCHTVVSNLPTWK